MTTSNPQQCIETVNIQENLTDPTEKLIDTRNHANISTHSMDSAPIKSNTLPTIPQHNRLTTIRLIQAAETYPISPSDKFQLHIDGGANRSITNNPNQLIHLRNIKPYYMSSASNTNDIKCTAIGYLPWRSPEHETILVKCFYSKQAADTIISPSDIVLNHLSTYHSWTQHADMLKGTGYITFTNNQTDHNTTYPLYHDNGLWYYHNDNYTDYSDNRDTHNIQPMVRWLTKEGIYELIHARLGHPGECIMSQLHLHVEGVDKITKPNMFKCKTCMLVKATKRAITTGQLSETLAMETKEPFKGSEPKVEETTDAIHGHTTNITCQPGERLHMDMGFIRGTKYNNQVYMGFSVQIQNAKN